MLSSITGMYRPKYAQKVVLLLQQQKYQVWRYLSAYWQTQNFNNIAPGESPKSTRAKQLIRFVQLGLSLQVIVGIVLIVLGLTGNVVGGVAFGLAALVSYPVIWAHILALIILFQQAAYYLSRPKELGREIVCRKLESQVRSLRKAHPFTLVAVAGSIGKTSTKLAIADLLAQTKRVRYQVGNYNDRVTVPLVLFGQPEPNIINVFAWLRIFRANDKAIQAKFPHDVVVVELGTDAPGQLEKFAYLAPDISVVTAVAPEHMEYFKTLDAVAEEELTVFDFSKQVLVNADDIAPEYLKDRTFRQYSLSRVGADYYAKRTPKDLFGQHVDLTIGEKKIETDVQYIGEQGAKFALAAAAVANLLDVSNSDIAKGLGHLKHFAGRMQILDGIKNTTLIDDTYNASPAAVIAALDVLYSSKTPQRIALIGNMNELGEHSKLAHKEIGAYCDPKKLDLVVTLGTDANKYTAPAAKRAGCTVKTCTSPHEAGEYIKEQLREKATVLVKGSQNGVFAEEALKPLLANEADQTKLVRQSAYWLKMKQKQFSN